MLEEGGFVIETRYSAWQQKKVRTILVNCHSKNPAQRVIANAIAIAKAYDRIELAGGTYNEALSISLPLEIVASEAEEPHIVSRTSAITLTANVQVHFENIHLVTKSTSKLDAAVVVMAGNPSLVRCHLSSAIVGGSANAVFRRCTISDSASGYGLIVQDGGGGLVHSSSVYHHSTACVDIDSRGSLQLTECTLYNRIGKGNVLVVSGLSSSTSREHPPGFPSESQVEVSHCQLYVGGDGGGEPSLTFASLDSLDVMQCCVAVVDGASPIFESNELLEGEVGFMFESSGSAQLRGNIIRCQRRCGILALVEDGYAYLQGHRTLCITGDNVLDRCAIGVDVQCTSMGRSTGPQAASQEAAAPSELPKPKRAFQWLPSEPAAAASSASRRGDADRGVMLFGEQTTTISIRSRLATVVTMALEAHPSCLQPSFSAVSEAAASVVSEASASVNLFAVLLNQLLLTNLTSLKKEAALEKMLQLRGNQGVDIINTKFSNCDLCAIRFGRQGHGLVEQCVFEDCGTHAIVVDSAAHPLITGCRFLRSRSSSIYMGNFANAFIVGNEIASGKADGIVATHLSRGVVVGNIINSNQGCGLHVDHHSQVLISANEVGNNRSGGVVVGEHSTPLILFNLFIGNLVAHVSCSEFADAFIAHNSLQSGPDAGVLLTSCSRCTVALNEITANGNGIVVMRDADPLVEDNTLFQNVRTGILCEDNALGTFVNNVLNKNTTSHVLVQHGSSPVFRGNTVQNGVQGGVVVASEGCGLFEYNRISQNSVANVIVADVHSHPIFIRNAIFGSSSGCGVICSRGAGGSFEDNHIYENKQCGVYSVGAANSTFTANCISREAVGVLFSNRGKGVFQYNRVCNCYGAGVISQGEGCPDFENNSISQCGLSGLLVGLDSLGHFSHNNIFENDVGVQLGSSLQAAELNIQSVYIDPPPSAASKETSSSLSGLHLGEAASCPRTGRSALHHFASAADARRASMQPAPSCQVQHNRIHHNKNGGVLLERHASAVLEFNNIYENEAFGIRGDVHYSARRAEEVLQKKFAVRQVVVEPSRAPQSSGAKKLMAATLRHNKIYHHAEANVFIASLTEALVTIAECELFDAPIGIYVGNRSAITAVVKSYIHHCQDGVYMESDGEGSFRENRVSQCAHVGVYVSDGAAPSWGPGNLIEACGMSGIMVDAGGRGVFSHGVVKHCAVGAIVFTGPTTPYNVSFEEVVKASLVSSTPVFEHNVIEEHEQHGILLLSVINGCPLRTPRKRQLSEASATSFDGHYTPSAAGVRTTTNLAVVGERLCPYFASNTIRRNRAFGVYYDRFDHWDFDALDSAQAGDPVKTVRKIKNAYGGYEVLLGTSQVLHLEDHHSKREAKQTSFVDNEITQCSIGFGAGYGCHPFLRRNRITCNDFFGLVLRFGSAVMSHGCDICHNGIAGVYAASGAKGFLADGHVVENNGASRPVGSPAQPRRLDAMIFSQRFVPSQADWMGNTRDFYDIRVARAYEQMTHLLEVHNYTMVDALFILRELTSMPSDSTALASGACPDFTTCSELESGSGGGGGGDVAARPRCLQIAVPDGGLGVWIEEGSRTTVRANEIAGHNHAGVFFSKGVLSHYKALRVVHKPQELLDESHSNRADVLRGALERPPLANAEPGVFFATQPLCAAGIIAAVQVSSAVESLEVTMNSASLLSHAGPLDPLRANASVSAAGGHDKEPRQDSIHYALVSQNHIARNEHGAFVELYHVLRAHAAPAGGPSRPAQPRRATVTNRAEVLSAARDPSSLHEAPTEVPALSAADVAIVTEGQGMVDYNIVLKENDMYENKTHGVVCQHIVEVDCSRFIPSRVALNEAIVHEHEAVRRAVVLRQPPAQLPQPFQLTTIPQKTTRAHIVQNEIYHNGGDQAHVSSRYVMWTGDKTKTLLLFDTQAAALSSPYASRALFRVPLYAAVVQLPPPGLFQWEENVIRDGKYGVHLCGYLGARSSRFTGNRFHKIEEDALRIEGHMACSTVGSGNLFEDNGVAVRISVDVPSGNDVQGFADGEAFVSEEFVDLRTRLFANRFVGSRRSSVLLDNVGDLPVLLQQNYFGSHAPGSCAVLLSGEQTRVHVCANEFTTSYTPLVVVNDAGKGTPSKVIIWQNHFYCNYIGALVGGGAAPRLLHNVFERNTRAGLELAHAAAAPFVHGCVFRHHRRGSGAGGDAASSTASDSSFPVMDKLVIGGGAVSVELTEGNKNVLSPSSSLLLPAGIVLGPLAEGTVRRCLFEGNDIGVDALCEAYDSLRVFDSARAAFTSCLFRRNAVAGVLLRGNGASQAPSASVSRLASTEDQPPDASQQQSTLFQQCFFLDHAGEAPCGDVLNMTNGCATFRQNIFYGTVQAAAGAAAVFAENHFTVPLESPTAAPPAVVLHGSSHALCEGNVIYGRKVGVQALPGSAGWVQKNTIVHCARGVYIAPFSKTHFRRNRVWQSTDCGIFALSGIIVENDVMRCPTGIVVQKPSAYQGINAVPMSMRGASELTCARNIITSCDLDGILVTCGGSFEGNVISHCKNGINIVAPPPPATSTESIPNVKSNVVFDNKVGILLDKDSASSVIDNDAFDSDELGVLVMPSASGFLHGNRISTPFDHGAADIAADASVKSSGNVIRNQFSPAYNRGSRGGRAKEFEEKCSAVDAELTILLDRLTETEEGRSALVSSLELLLKQLLELLTKLTVEAKSPPTHSMAGAASLSLRRATLSAPIVIPNVEAAVSANQSPSKISVRSSSRRSISQSSSKAAPHFPGVVVGAKRRQSAPQQRKSYTAAMARKKALPATSKDSGGGMHSSSPLPVLIHVFCATEMDSAAGNAVGEVVARVLTAAPLTNLNLHTTVTTSSDQLLSYLELHNPCIVIAVVDATKRVFSKSDCGSLLRLHNSIAPSRVASRRGSSGGPAELNISRLLIPEHSLLASEKTGADDESGGMSLADFAVQHDVIRYKDGVEEALPFLRDAITNNVEASLKATRRPRKASSSSAEDASTSARPPHSQTKTNTSTKDHGSQQDQSATAAKGPRPSMSYEQMTNLLSLFTPEALGIDSPAHTQRRKSSVGTELQGAPGKTKKNNSRRPSLASATRRKSASAHPKNNAVPLNCESGVKGLTTARRGSVQKKGKQTIRRSSNVSNSATSN